jgi:hypothetical protein
MDSREILTKAEKELNEDFELLEDIELKMENGKVKPSFEIEINGSKKREQKKLREARENLKDSIDKYASKAWEKEGERKRIEESKLV